MAPTKKEANDKIGSISISNPDFFKNRQCPMRTGNVRCRNISTCCGAYHEDRSAHDKAKKLRDQLMSRVKSLSSGATSDSTVWNTIEKKVQMLIHWVLCNKHMAQQDEAVLRTMRFLKQECGIFVEEKGAQSHTTQASGPKLCSSKDGSNQSYSSYASVATHLATPPESPARPAHQQAHQPHFVFQASVSTPKKAPSDLATDKQPQPSSFDFRFDKPVKTEPGTSKFTAPLHELPGNASVPKPGKEGTPLNATSTKPQQPPAGFRVRPRTSNRQTTTTVSAKLPQTETIKQEPPATPIAHPPGREEPQLSVPTLQSTKPKPAPPGFGVRPRAKETPIRQVAQPKTHSDKAQRSSLPADHKDALDHSPRSQIDEMVNNLEALELGNQKFADDNKSLLEDNRRLKAKYQKASDQVHNLKRDNEKLQSDARDFKAKIEGLEKELAALRRKV